MRVFFYLTLFMEGVAHTYMLPKVAFIYLWLTTIKKNVYYSYDSQKKGMNICLFGKKSVILQRN